jgi:hypothetical protein
VGQSGTSDGLAPNQHHFAVLMLAFEGEDDWYGPRWEVECERRGEDHVHIPLHMGRADAGGCVCLTRS